MRQAVKSAAAYPLPGDEDDDDVVPLSLSQDGIAITGEAAAPGPRAFDADVLVVGEAPATDPSATQRRAATPFARAAAPARPGSNGAAAAAPNKPVVVDLSLDDDDDEAGLGNVRPGAARLGNGTTGARTQPGGPAAPGGARGGEPINTYSLFAYPDDSPETQRRKLEALQQVRQAQAKQQQQPQQQQQQHDYQGRGPASQRPQPGPGLLGHLSAAASAGAAGGAGGSNAAGGGGGGGGGGAFGSIRGILEPAGAAGRAAPAAGGTPGAYGGYSQNPYQPPQNQAQYGGGASGGSQWQQEQGLGKQPQQHTPPPAQTPYQQYQQQQHQQQSPYEQLNPYLPPTAAGGPGGYGGGAGGAYGGGGAGGAYGGGDAGGAYGGAGGSGAYGGVPTPQPYGGPGAGAAAFASRSVSHVSDTYAGPARPAATGATTHVSATVFGPSGSIAGSYAAGAGGGGAGGAGGAARGIAVVDEGEVASPQLTREQERVLALVRAGENIFFTGNAGTGQEGSGRAAWGVAISKSGKARVLLLLPRAQLCLAAAISMFDTLQHPCSVCDVVSLPAGKTFVLTRVVDELRERYSEDFGSKVAVCASTGIAATHIGGEGGGRQLTPQPQINTTQNPKPVYRAGVEAGRRWTGGRGGARVRSAGGRTEAPSCAAVAPFPPPLTAPTAASSSPCHPPLTMPLPHPPTFAPAASPRHHAAQRPGLRCPQRVPGVQHHDEEGHAPAHTGLRSAYPGESCGEWGGGWGLGKRADHQSGERGLGPMSGCRCVWG